MYKMILSFLLVLQSSAHLARWQMTWPYRWTWHQTRKLTSLLVQNSHDDDNITSSTTMDDSTTSGWVVVAGCRSIPLIPFRHSVSTCYSLNSAAAAVERSVSHSLGWEQNGRRGGNRERHDEKNTERTLQNWLEFALKNTIIIPWCQNCCLKRFHPFFLKQCYIGSQQHTQHRWQKYLFMPTLEKWLKLEDKFSNNIVFLFLIQPILTKGMS